MTEREGVSYQLSGRGGAARSDHRRYKRDLPGSLY